MCSGEYPASVYADHLTRHYIAYNVPFQLSTDTDSLLATFDNVLPYGTETTGSASRSAEQFRLLHSTRSGEFCVYAGAILTLKTHDRPSAFDHLRRSLMVHVADHAPTRVFVHAGVVAWNERALLFPGRSFAGKTTLVAALVKAGAHYYSDEYAVVDSAGRVHPHARELQMRRPGSTRQESISLASLGGAAGAEPLYVSAVLFSEYSDGACWRPQRVSAGVAVLEMSQHTICMRRHPARALATLTAVMSRAKAWRSQRGEAASLSPEIFKLLQM